MGKHTETLRNYNLAKELRPELAGKYKFLAPGNSKSGRVADASVSVEDLIWDEIMEEDGKMVVVIGG